MGKEKSTKKSKVILYFFIILLVSISVILFLFSIFLKSSVVLDKKEIPLALIIGDKSAFNISKDSSDLNFGTIQKENSAYREISVKNNYQFPIVLEMDIDGDIKDFLLFEKIVSLDIDEEKQIKVSTITIGDESYGNYSGRLIITFKRDLSKE
jgi:hypothetical protein